MTILEKTLAVLDDGELSTLSSHVYFEIQKREDLKIKVGDFQPVLEEELALDKIQCIRAYRDRTKSTLSFAKKVVDLVKK